MNRLTRRNFITTAVISAFAVACTRNTTEVKSPTAITKTPTRIVALEWVYVENLLALEIQPIGVADISGYKRFVDIEPVLAASVVDIGTRQEPNLETIAQLQPDLIIGVKLRHEPIYDNLSSIAPTLLFDPYPAPNEQSQLAEMEQTFLTIADTVNRRSTAEKVWQQMRENFKIATEQMRSLQLIGRPFILGQFPPQSSPQLRLFTANAIAVQILEQIGLKNSWQGDLDRFGFNTVWVEALTKVEQANFLYITEANNTHWQQIQTNPVWNGLEFVLENRLYLIGADTWVFGGPLSAQVLVKKVVTALTKK